jgi:hypothetical protein
MMFLIVVVPSIEDNLKCLLLKNMRLLLHIDLKTHIKISIINELSANAIE